MSELEEESIYISHTSTGKGVIMVHESRLRALPEHPGWSCIALKDERDFLRTAAQLMNYADLMTDMRKNDELPALDD